MSGNHTPGPWEVWGGANSYCFDGVIRSQSSPNAIAFVDAHIYEEDGEIVEIKPTPDTRLIAAAPCMLEALRRILILIQESHGVFGFHLNGDLSDWSEHQDDIDVIQNAIEKATGEEG